MPEHQPEELVLLLSDLQPGLRTPTYNAEVFVERLNRVVETTLRLGDIHSLDRPIEVLHIAAAGDFVEGEPYTGRINPAELDTEVGSHRPLDILGQKRLLQDTLEAALLRLGERFCINFYGVGGNHGANRGKFASERSNDDLEVYLNLADRLRRVDGIQFHVETDKFYTTFNVLGHPFLLVHGHQIKMWSRTPLYGIIHATTLWHQVLPEPFEAVLMGHFHSMNLVDAVGTPVYLNGAFCADDQYGAAKGLKATPAQWLLGVHERRGIAWERRIWLV